LFVINRHFPYVTGMPCMHVVAAISHMRGSLEDYYDAWLTMTFYWKTYQHVADTVQGQEHWEQTNQIPFLPLVKKNKGGKPEKQRRNNPTEEAVNPKPHKIKRKLGAFKCLVCGEENYNKQSCPITKKKKRTGEFLAQQATVATVEGDLSQPAVSTTNALSVAIDSTSRPDEIEIS